MNLLFPLLQLEHKFLWVIISDKYMTIIHFPHKHRTQILEPNKYSHFWKLGKHTQPRILYWHPIIERYRLNIFWNEFHDRLLEVVFVLPNDNWVFYLNSSFKTKRFINNRDFIFNTFGNYNNTDFKVAFLNDLIELFSTFQTSQTTNKVELINSLFCQFFYN